MFKISKWIIRVIAPIVKEAIKDVEPVIKEVATEAAKAYVQGQMESLTKK